MDKSDKQIVPKHQLTFLAGYGLALASTALSALARWLLPWALAPAPYLGFYPAVVVSAALGGVGPGLLSTFLSLFLVNFVFGRINIQDHGAIGRQIIWITASVGVSLLAGMQRAARMRERLQAEQLRRLNDELESRVQQRTDEVQQANSQLREANEKLAQLDRTKTIFFSNVSHELRTPLTLILGPLEHALARPETVLAPDLRQNIALAHSNALRLLKLVNTLLDFSRIEAGRHQASYHPTELGALTGGLASIFRSTIENAGLEFVMETPALPRPVHVDRGMWEKIVLNLVSNAFKFTLQGRIAVRLRDAGDHVEFSVEDTGCGIPEKELANVFKRFHRIEGSAGRTYEGTGIGLSLVEELVRLHGGSVSVVSTPGRGSTFTVSIPFGAGHLPPEQVGTGEPLSVTVSSAAACLEEARSWLPEESRAGATPAATLEAAPGAGPRACVLLADDNADMREYVTRLLGASYDVVAVPDGEAAWAAIQTRRPDLVLTDVMMPRLDGFGLLARLREAPGTRTLPVVLLSARAGEESRVEGLEAGADDYLVKPFSGRELVARVRTNLEMARLREESVRVEEQLKAKEKDNAELERLVEARTEELEEHRAELEMQNEELQELYRHLEEETAQRVQAVEDLRAKERMLVQQSRTAAMGDMLFNMAHQWRQPLNAVGLTIQKLGLLYQHGELSKEILDENIAKAMSMLLQLSRTINDFTDFSRPDQGKTMFRVDQVISKTLALTCDSFREQEIAIVVEATGEPEMQGYANEFGQVLLNILTNARDALLEKRTEAARITVRAWAEPEKSVVTITDNAGGIGDEIIDKIFDPFFTTKEQGKGTGVGLYLAKTIVETKMNGRLTALNVEEGAEFRIEVGNGKGV